MISKSLSLARAVGMGVVLVAVLSAGEIYAANILTNSGFETANLSGWSTFGANNYSQTGGSPHSGTNYYKVYGQFSGVNNYTGIYQDNSSAPGAVYSADGWAYSDVNDNGGIHGQDAIWVEVSFRDASKNALALYRSIVVTSNNIASFGGLNTWFDLQITNQCSFTNAVKVILLPGTVTNTVTSLVAPAGTAYVRYQVVFAQGPDNASGSMYFDDLTLGGAVVAAPVWNIVWDDEFNGTSIDTNIWAFETGNGGSNPGWGNQEREYYTSRTNNAYVDGNGLLHIVAQQESMGGFNFTSARMKTEWLYSTPTYGHIQWRAKLPTGYGMWPALWMMGTNIDSVNWPTCGEIDVVENPGNPTFNQSSLHSGTDYQHVISQTGYYYFTGGDSITNFHTYEMDWSASSIQFFVDGNLYETQSGGPPFNAPFFFLMNLAVGGTYPGTVGVPDSNIIASNTFPKEILVDYVRVYEQTAPLQITATQSNGNVVLTWPTNIVCHLQAQTNSLAEGSWLDIGNTTNPLVIAPDPNNASVFFRLASP
jgi:beta-glucanase (GH16 family)